MIDKDYVCEDWGTENEWTQIKVTVKLEQLDDTVAVMNMVSNYLQIEDYSDIDLKTCYGDLIDEAILNADKTVASVLVYLSKDAGVVDTLNFLKSRFAELAIDAQISVSGVNEEDWANSWKDYYKPIKIGDKIVIVPAWEKYEASEGEIIVRMDPGMAFGTGTHETTRLVIKLLEKYIKQGMRVADVGCGSGILAICAAKYGAGVCRAYDIDPIAVEVAAENAIENGCEIECAESDLLAGVKAEQYDVICANIVADIIIRMAPDVGKFMKDTSTLLASGIITERAEEVTDALEAAGLYIVESIEDNGWCALAVKKLIK